MEQQGKPRVVVAGASGFVGRPLVERLSQDFHVVGLTRSVESARKSNPDLAVEWVECDLYSLSSVERALQGASYAVYLVHSMMPSIGLTQASFEDLDLLLADNFARAAATHQLEQIVYLGGLLPDNGPLSTHLTSRREVEEVLGSRGVPLTILRAGLVIGSDGSSFRILRRLVSRLPLMVLPAWTRTQTTPIALADVVELLARSVSDRETYGLVSDVGGPDTVSYRRLLEATASAMGHSRPSLSVPFLSPGLSTLWVHLVSRSPWELVRPLVASLECEMIARNRLLQAQWGHDGMSIEEAIAQALAGESAKPNSKRLFATKKRLKMVRSIQRLPRPPAARMSWLAAEYRQWLGRFFRPLLTVRQVNEKRFSIHLSPLTTPLLTLEHSASHSREDRESFDVVGGSLAHPRPLGRGRLEFRDVRGVGEVLAALHDFTPRLPWMLYRISQAPLHRWVMTSFAAHLSRSARTASHRQLEA